MNEEKKIQALGDEELDAVPGGARTGPRDQNHWCPYCHEYQDVMRSVNKSAMVVINGRHMLFNQFECIRLRLSFYSTYDDKLYLDESQNPINV